MSDFLSTQNTKLLEDIAAIREERDTLKAKVEEQKEGAYEDS